MKNVKDPSLNYAYKNYSKSLNVYYATELAQITSVYGETRPHFTQQEFDAEHLNISLNALEKFVLDEKRITGLIAEPKDGKM